MDAAPLPRLDELLPRALGSDAARPLLTYYDDATGERAELSVATFGNWVAKTANFLRDTIDIAPGERVAIRLPPHWQYAVWLTACWTVGAVAVPLRAESPEAAPRDETRDETRDAAAGAAVTVIADDDQPPPPGELVVLGLGPLGLPRSRDERSLAHRAGRGAFDYDREIHRHGDHFSRPDAAARRPEDVVLELDGRSLTEAVLLQQVCEALTRWRVRRGDRILCARQLDTLPAILGGLLVPLAASATAVLCRRLDLARLPERVDTEKIVAALRVPGLPPSYLPGVALL